MSRQPHLSIQLILKRDIVTTLSICETLSTLPMQSTTHVLLKTAFSLVWTGNQTVSANKLSDEGSQKSFISEYLATKLQINTEGNTKISLTGTDNLLKFRSVFFFFL